MDSNALVILDFTNGPAVTYPQGLQMQERIAAARRAGSIPDVLILLEHEPVITYGKTAESTNLLTSTDALGDQGVALFGTNRGGDMTYHGPGQLTGYPIIHLGENNRDVRGYIAGLESNLLKVGERLGVPGLHTVDFHAGIWLDRKYVAAVGVRIKQWVTMHGFAINVTRESLAGFRHIIPCGVQAIESACLSGLAGNDISVALTASTTAAVWSEQTYGSVTVLHEAEANEWISARCPPIPDGEC
ncbi:MAG: lipoyl(octanoyl) transferase LipB [Armatimonadota bacterium]